MNTQNYWKVLEEAIEEMKELWDISRNGLFLQIGNLNMIDQFNNLKYIIKII